MGMKPFYLDAQGWGMDQAFMFIERPPSREPLTDADLAELKVTRDRATGILKRLNASRDRVLRNTGTGSYRVLLQRKMTTHIDFSDLPLLAAKNQEEIQRCLDVMRVVRRYSRAFFDKYVRTIKEPLLDSGVPNPLIESVQRFGPSKRPN